MAAGQKQRPYRWRVALTVRCFQFLPLGLRKALFTALALAAYHVLPRQRLIALYNLKTAFPDKDMAEVKALAGKVYRHMAQVGAEFFDIPRLTRDNIGDIVEVEGQEHCRESLAQGKGLLLFSAHLGNWELGAIAFSLFFMPNLIIYRPLDNAFLNALVHHVRSATGNRPVPKERAMMQMMRTLKKNGTVGMLIDQNVAREEGVFVDFFGRQACTTDGLAQLALRTGAPVHPLFILRQASGRHRLVMGEEVKTVNTGAWESDVLVNTQNFTAVIEEMVRRHPEQWLWVHNRWKTKPWQEY